MKKFSVLFIAIILVIGAYINLPSHNLYDSKRILQLGIFTVIGLMILMHTVVAGNLKCSSDCIGRIFSSNCIKWIIIILIISTLISIYLSNYPEKAVVDVVYYLILLTLSYTIASKFLKEHYLLGKIIYGTALFYTGIYITIFLGNYISSFYDPFIAVWPNKIDYTIDFGEVAFKGKEILYFVNRRFFNQTQTWTFPLLVGLFVFFNRNKGYKNLAPIIFILISIWWMLLYQTGGRGTTLSVFVAGAFLWAVSKQDFTPFVKPLVLSSLTGWGLKFLFFELPFSDMGQSVLRTQHSRFYRIEGALEVWWENPWFGIGPGHYGEIGPTQFVGHPHNYYLQILSEWGVIAFICIAILFFVAASFVWKKFHQTNPGSTNRLNFLVISWAFIAACCHAFFSGVMHTPLSQMWLVLILSWFIGYYKRGHNNKFKTEGVPVLVYVISLAIVLYVVIPEILTLPEMYQRYAEHYPDRSLYPRFWGQGLFPIE